jgi:hypothetical protein
MDIEICLKDKIKLIVFGMMILSLIIVNTLNLGPESFDSYVTKHNICALGETKVDLYGTIVGKYIDEENHNFPTIIVKDTCDIKYTFLFSINKAKIYNYSEIGDSIFCKRFSRKVKVWNKHKSKSFDLRYEY